MRLFHDGRDFSGLLNDVFLVDWNFFRGGMLIFSEVLRFFHGIKIIPSEFSFLSGCSRFSRGGRLSFFQEEVQFFLGGGENTS